MNTPIKHAIILAGGKGERLRPYTEDRPKVMVEVAGKPILQWQIEWLKLHGIENFILTVSYKHEVIQNFIGDGKIFGIQVDYSIEETPLGRGGAIKKGFNSPLIQGAENLVVTNGDVITKMDLSLMMEQHKKRNALVTMLLVPYLSRWGIVRVDDQNQINGFEEKPRLPYWINGGIYLFNQGVVDLLPDLGDHETETFPKIPKERFFAFKDEGFWRAVDVVKDKTEAEKFLETGQQDFK